MINNIISVSTMGLVENDIVKINKPIDDILLIEDDCNIEIASNLYVTILDKSNGKNIAISCAQGATVKYIIVDSAPSRYIQDTSMIAPLCDATFVVVQQNNATCKVINDTIYCLVNNHANVIGTIYNASVFDFIKAQNSYGYRYGNYRYHRERGSK